MIDWNTILVKPMINSEDAHDLKNGVSIRVVVRLTDDIFIYHAFARYNHQVETWQIEGFLGNCYHVTHWTSLNEPLI